MGRRRYAAGDSQERAPKDRTPTPPSHPSRAAFETKKDMAEGMLCEPPRHHGRCKEECETEPRRYALGYSHFNM